MARKRREFKDAVGVEGIRKAISQTLELYADEVREQIDAIEESIAKRAVKKLRVAGSFDDRRDAKGYRTTWRAKKRDDLSGWIVHNTSNYQLTHLLEYGHALRNGGRSRAFPHIKPVEKEVIKEFEKEIREVLGK